MFFFVLCLHQRPFDGQFLSTYGNQIYWRHPLDKLLGILFVDNIKYESWTSVGVANMENIHKNKLKIISI